MPVQPEDNKTENEMMARWERDHRRGKIIGGIIIVGVGGLILAKEMGAAIPTWLFTWKFLLIVIGLFAGVKHSFRNLGWLIPIFIGSAFLLQDFYPQFIISNYIWPIALILFGLIMIFKPRGRFREHRWNRHYRHNRRHYGRYWEEQTATQKVSSDDYLEVDSVFGSVQRNIISKDFKGGEINVVFGGSEINLTQADINGRVVLEINTVFGGTQLIVPPHWEIKSELTAVMGGVEDKRMVLKEPGTDGSKVLVLKGSVVFGGIEIKSY